MSIPQCIIFEFPDTLSQWQHIRFWLSISEIPVKKCIVGMLLTCPISVYQIKVEISDFSPSSYPPRKLYSEIFSSTLKNHWVCIVGICLKDWCIQYFVGIVIRMSDYQKEMNLYIFFHIFSRSLLSIFAFQCKLLDTFPLEAGTYDPSKRVIPFLPGESSESLHRARPCNVLYLITWLTLRALLLNSVKLITAQFQFF